MQIKDIIFSVLYGWQGYPRNVGNKRFRFDESLRRWDFDGEVEVRESISKEISAGDVAIDVGANFGMHTLIMADRAGTTGRVIAFEPVPANLTLLRRNVQLNSFESRVNVVATAISDIPSQTIRMAMDSDSLEPSAAISTKSDGKKQEIDVVNQSLDAALSKIENAQHCFIKIDVEGAEMSVLRSGVNALARLKPTLLIEVHDYALPSFNESTESVYAFLKDHGFSIEQLSDMSNHNGQYHHILAKPR